MDAHQTLASWMIYLINGSEFICVAMMLQFRRSAITDPWRAFTKGLA